MAYLNVINTIRILNPNTADDNLLNVYLKQNAILVVNSGYHNTSLCIFANENSLVFVGQNVKIDKIICEKTTCAVYSPVQIRAYQSELFLYNTCNVRLWDHSVAFSRSRSKIYKDSTSKVFYYENTILW